MTGRAGVQQVRDERGLRAMQLRKFWLYVDEEDAGYTNHALNDGYWEAWITLWMDQNVGRNTKCIDVGANHGYYSFFLAAFKDARVWAFEPQPRLAELIRKSSEVNHLDVKVEEVALADKDGKIDMMVPTHHGMNATISNEFTHAPEGYGTIEVETWALDECFENEEIDFIKVDAEGAEDLIWAGSKKFRERQPQAVWLVEWRYDRYKEPERFAEEIFSEYDVWSVETDGSEVKIDSPETLYTVQHADWMLVLRRK